jgi:hypothetical protein
MSLTGPFYNAVNEDENIYDVSSLVTPGEIALGVIPADYIFEELKCIVTVPAPSGTTFKLVDQHGSVIIPAGKITPDRAVSTTANINKRITGQVRITGVFEGPASAGGCEMVLIKKIYRIP